MRRERKAAWYANGICISIHAPTWGATVILFRKLIHVAISIHAPTWGATCESMPQSIPKHTISIHAPTWGATKVGMLTERINSISIHAPTWGATQPPSGDQRAGPISIHAPTWGATFLVGLCFLELLEFQSTHPHGVRLGRARTVRTDTQISIHAPTWGATHI